MSRTITLTDLEISVLASIMQKIEKLDKKAVCPRVKSPREFKKVALLKKYKHIIPDFTTIAKLAKAEGLYSQKSNDSDIAFPLQRLAIKEGLHQ